METNRAKINSSTRQAPQPIGDCFVAAFDVIHSLKSSVLGRLVENETLLCHGLAIHAPSGNTMRHAWVEIDVLGLPLVIDESNGNKSGVTVFFRDNYYALGGVKRGTIIRYTREKAIETALKTGHYGEWDESLKGYA